MSGTIELVLKNEITSLFKTGFCDNDCIDPMGYDIRLGDEVVPVTRGESKKTLKNGEAFTVFPGETLLVKSEEVLNLPNTVCAIGSPKMSLILKGLWAHGGKTDFGYNQRLTLGFRHLGASPIELKRGQKIFHLTFLRVNNGAAESYSGRGLEFPSVDISPLDGNPKLDDKLEKLVKEKEGIQLARIVHLIRNEVSYMKRSMVMSATLSVIIIVAGIIAVYDPTLTKTVIYVTMILGLFQILFNFRDMIKELKPKSG